MANKYLPFFRDEHTWTTNALKGVVFRDYEDDVTLDQCYKAKRMAFKMIHGVEEKQYERLWDYETAIWKWNVGSIVKIQIVSNLFKGMYVCLDACKRGFLAGCRLFIRIDCCHLKGTTEGQLLVAIGKDRNDNIFPIAYAIVEINNKSSWTWFLQCLLDGCILYMVLSNQIWVLNNQVKVVQRMTTLVEARRIRERLRFSGSKKINNFLVQYFV